MNSNIKQVIEKYVIGGFEELNTLDSNNDEYYNTRSCIIKEISTLVEILQKEDVNENNSNVNELKIKNEITKVDNEYVINLKKLECEKDKNKDYSQLEHRKIDCTEKKNISESKLKSKELKMNMEHDIEIRSDRIIKVMIDGATILVPIIFYNIWMNKGFKFEETGTYTSNTFKNLFSRFKPTK